MQKRPHNHNQPRIITPAGAAPPPPTNEEVLMMQYQGLAQFWERYGTLLSKCIETSDEEAAGAFKKAAEYVRQLIELAEGSMKDE